MGQNIFVVALCVIALAATIWGWWVDNGGNFKIDRDNNIDECEGNRDEKN